MSKLPSYNETVIETLTKELAEYRQIGIEMKKTLEDHKKKEEALKDPRSNETLQSIADCTGNSFEEIKEYSDIFYKHFEFTNDPKDSVIKEDVKRIFKTELKRKPKMKIINLYFRTNFDHVKLKEI